MILLYAACATTSKDESSSKTFSSIFSSFQEKEEVSLEEVIEPPKAPLMSKEDDPENPDVIFQYIDMNSDGKPDIRNHLLVKNEDRPILLIKEIDINWDGRFDMRTYFDESSSILKEETDADYDGRIDWIDHYVDNEKEYTL